ncbi:MAG: response regulator [Deltaproteobacteria bacterium]|nr:response regulator [Deltaproteobacteria bacterium]
MPTKPQIVFVDDDVLVLNLVQRMLSKSDIECHVYTDPKKATEHVRSHPVDAFFSDINMPDISGSDLLPIIHEIDPTLALVLVSGVHTATSIPGEGTANFASIFFTKPFTQQRLEQIAKVALQQTRRNRQRESA